MPVLKFRCNDCGKEFAKILIKPEDTPKKCLVCGAADLAVIGPAFDYRNKDLERIFCVSCDSCEHDAGCSKSPE